MNISFYFNKVTAPRVTGRYLYLLSDILMISLYTYLTGSTDYENMRMFVLEHGGELSDMLSMPNGVPSTDTFEHVFQRTHPAELDSYDKSILDDLAEKQNVIDSKEQCGASSTSRGNKRFYILDTWVRQNCFCIAQAKAEDKSNEITGISEILSGIDIEDAVVPIDAMGKQREIVELIVHSDHHYLLTVKKNQRSLHENMECTFRVKDCTDFYEESYAGYERIKTRRCSILPAKDYLMKETLEPWKNLSTIVGIESVHEIEARMTRELRYCISDEKKPKASYYAALTRGYWSIENQLHWYLDITFKEDECRARKGFASQNLSLLRKIALHIVSEQKDKLSMKRRLYKAALDINYSKKHSNFDAVALLSGFFANIASKLYVRWMAIDLFSLSII